MALESKNEAWNRAPPIFLQFQSIIDRKIMGAFVSKNVHLPSKTAFGPWIISQFTTYGALEWDLANFHTKFRDILGIF